MPTWNVADAQEKIVVHIVMEKRKTISTSNRSFGGCFRLKNKINPSQSAHHCYCDGKWKRVHDNQGGVNRKSRADLLVSMSL